MGCACCSLSSFISVCLNAFERATMCTVCAVITFCLLFTILAVLAIGVGIGFHYCFVTQTVNEMSKAAKLTAGAEEGPTKSARRANVLRALNQGLARGLVRRARRAVGLDTPQDNVSNMTMNLTLSMNDEQLFLRNFSSDVGLNKPLDNDISNMTMNLTLSMNDEHLLLRNFSLIA